MQFTTEDLSKLITDLESEFSTHIAKAELEAAVLTKAEDEKPADEKEEPSEDKAEDKPEAKEESEAPKADAAEEKAAPAEDAPKADEQAKEASEKAIYDDEDMQHLEKMYMSMSKDEQLIHHDVLRKCMDSAQPEAQAASAAESHKHGDEMKKSENIEAATVEVKAEDVKANPEVELAKSEAVAANAKAEQLQKSLDTVQEFLTKLVKKVPQGKAITSMEQIAKSEDVSSEGKELSKSEISAILGKKAADSKLSKSDRDAINAFYLNGANINTISHLLKN